MKTIQKTVIAFVLIIPFLEIYLLLEVGSIIGAIPTILLVIMTAFIGANLVRQQGFSIWQRLQANLAQGIMPAYELIEGVLILAGGLLLLTPGFFTDALGFMCLLPKLRQQVARYIFEHHLFSVIQGGSSFNTAQQRDSNVLEGEFKKDDF